MSSSKKPQTTSDSGKKGKAPFAVVVKKAMSKSAHWDKTSFPEFPDVLHWARQALGIIFGIILGFLGVTGWQGIATYAAGSSFVLFTYWSKYLEVDEEDFGQWAMLSEGFMSSFGLFILSWTISYSAML
eukprot:PLAT15008.1.p1 GENE.PLAT15008.1~~PLAT15008.1.p1  ORF type:complete len:129 (+),score=43.96 PLAT15008.1:85-471(+)